MAVKGLPQNAERAQGNTVPLPLLGVASALFDREKNPRLLHPRIFYVGRTLTMPVIGRLANGREAPSLTYAAVLSKDLLCIGQHALMPYWRSANAPPCHASTGRFCVEYSVTCMGIASADDWTKAKDRYIDDGPPQTWDDICAGNEAGIGALAELLLATNHMTDLFSANAARFDQAANDFAMHLPVIMQHAVAQVRAARQSAGG
ncbi:MAG TPA: hypothetical protein VGO07_03250 [Candidatus Saccharimonadales bacterium]|jgi:hypothetical protein|nr:hypothetical protein [Candidatus Saccharimonadales bacterium]